MTESSAELKRIRNAYEGCAADARCRAMWHPLNPVAIYYALVQHRELALLFRRLGEILEDKIILDAGCGTGSSLVKPKRIRA